MSADHEKTDRERAEAVVEHMFRGLRDEFGLRDILRSFDTDDGAETQLNELREFMYGYTYFVVDVFKAVRGETS